LRLTTEAVDSGANDLTQQTKMNSVVVYCTKRIFKTFYEPNTGSNLVQKSAKFFRQNIAKIAKKSATRQVQILPSNQIKK